MRPKPIVSLPVAVVMARKTVTQGRWTVQAWEATGIVAGEHVAGSSREPVLVREDSDAKQYLFGGLCVELHKDGAEGYWFNLAGEQPALYVVCHEGPDGDIRPFSVTADPNDASAAVEGDDSVFAVPIPPEVFRQIEEFVVKYYVPEERSKRKRKDWFRESGGE